MAKMFYTLEEVSEKLGKSEDEIKEMVRTGQIQEFRDRDKLMFKVEQIDLLAEDEPTGEVHLDLDASGTGSGLSLKDESGLGLADSGIGLADSGIGLADSGAQESLSLADSGQTEGLDVSEPARGLDLSDSAEDSAVGEGIGLSDSREGTGVSVFDTDHGAELAQTQADDGDDELGLESVGSGSGLLDLTRESDDTSLGAELLEEVYSSEDNVEIPAAASGLFEAAATERPADDVPSPAGGPVGSATQMPMLVEAYDGSGSGLGAGLLIGAVAALICVAIVAIVGVGGATPLLATKIASSSNSIWIWTGGLLGVTVILGLIGLFIGKASE